MDNPVIIEAALSPIRMLGEEPVFTVDQLIEEAKACIASGASVIHFHTDFRLKLPDTISEIVKFGKGVLNAYPDALYYSAPIGIEFEDSVAHLPAVRESGTLRMVTLEPGVALSGGLRDDGEPYSVFLNNISYEDCNKQAKRLTDWNIPLALGLMEAGSVRWATIQARRGALPPGSYAKFYLATDMDTFQQGKKGMNYGLPPTKAAVDALVEMIGDAPLPWMVLSFGSPIHEDKEFIRYVIEKGGHIRTGLEDASGNTNCSNAECVQAVADIVREMGRPIATIADTRKILGIKQADTVTSEAA